MEIFIVWSKLTITYLEYCVPGYETMHDLSVVEVSAKYDFCWIVLPVLL